MHVSRYYVWNLETSTYFQKMLETMIIDSHVHRFQGPPEVVISPRGGNSPELCDWWWPASGGSAPSEKHVLDLLSMYLVNLIDFDGFEALLVFFTKSGQSVQMTMPARCAPKFCTKRRAVTPEVLSQSLTS